MVGVVFGADSRNGICLVQSIYIIFYIALLPIKHSKCVFCSLHCSLNVPFCVLLTFWFIGGSPIVLFCYACMSFMPCASMYVS